MRLSRVLARQGSDVMSFWPESKLMAAACDEPVSRAHTLAVWLAAMLPAVAGDGAGGGGAPPVFDTVTVQVLIAPAVRKEGAHATALIVMGAERVMEAVWVEVPMPAV